MFFRAHLASKHVDAEKTDTGTKSIFLTCIPVTNAPTTAKIKARNRRLAIPSLAPLRVALLQATSAAGDMELALGQLEVALLTAGAGGAAILVAPETWLPGYNHSRIAKLALSRGDLWHKRLSAACSIAKCGLVVGYAENADGIIYNSALALDAEGHDLAHYRKIQLYGARETAIYTPGDCYVAFDLCGHKTALLICYDVEFSSHVTALTEAGVRLVLVPTANMMPFTHVMRATVPAMAANHGISIVYANYSGIEGDLTYAGGSVIVGPHGEIVAQAGETPALLIADLPARNPVLLSSQSQDRRTARWHDS